MRDGTRLTIMMTGLVVLGLLGSACSSGGGGMAPVPGGTPDAGADVRGGGATGTAGAAGGGATGTAGSSGSSYGGQTGPGSLADAGVLPDVARPIDAAVSADAALRPDVVPQPDFARKPDIPFQDDAGTRPEDAPSSDGSYKDGETSSDGGMVLYGLTPGASCYRITALLPVPGSEDGCDLGVASLTGYALPGNYDPSTGIFTLGTNGSLGVGPISYNQGTLVRNRALNTDPITPGCTWSQADTTALTMTDTNKFTVSVVEKEDSITAVCGLSFSACTSSWTWTMEIDASKSAPNCAD